MTTSEILDKAADQIDLFGWVRDGWINGNWADPETCAVCAGGAINVAMDYAPWCTHDDDAERAEQVFTAFAQRVDAAGFGELTEQGPTAVANLVELIAQWNDAPERTADQVIAELRAAAQVQRKAGR